jgi:hypothetical protein
MEFLETSVYRGPNVYALFPVIRHTVDLKELEEWPTARLGDDFVDGLVPGPARAVGSRLFLSGARRPASSHARGRGAPGWVMFSSMWCWNCRAWRVMT